jgi:hypothetical protein
MMACAWEETDRVECLNRKTAEQKAKRRGSGGGSLSGSGGSGGGGAAGAPRDLVEDIYASWIARSRIQGPDHNYRPVLSIHCKDEEMLGYIVVGMDVQSDRVGWSGTSFTNVTFWRDGNPFREEMRIGRNGERLYFNSSAEFSKKVTGANRLGLQFTPVGAAPAMTSFNISNFGEAISPVRKACGW